MYNSDIPSRADLPTSGQLVRSTLIAIVSAIVILVTIVLPAEYAIDPTGIGRVLGLAQMGEIKVQLAEEAERDLKLHREPHPEPPAAAPGQRSDAFGRMFSGLLIGSASAQTPAAGKKDQATVTLKPGEGAEIKLAMRQGAKVTYQWSVAGGVVNFDMHAHGGGKSISYGKGRAVGEGKGVLEAAFPGNHGWFWRNRGTANVTVTLTVEGEYVELKRM